MNCVKILAITGLIQFLTFFKKLDIIVFLGPDEDAQTLIRCCQKCDIPVLFFMHSFSSFSSIFQIFF